MDVNGGFDGVLGVKWMMFADWTMKMFSGGFTHLRFNTYISQI